MIVYTDSCLAQIWASEKLPLENACDVMQLLLDLLFERGKNVLERNRKFPLALSQRGGQRKTKTADDQG